MFDILMLPARHGDCLWLEYGSGQKTYRSLIDGGPGPTWPNLKAKLEQLPEGERHFELLVITHVDDDHIGGTLKLLKSVADLGVTFGDIWFNGYLHLDGKRVAIGPDLLGAKQGEALSKLIADNNLPWNRAFDGRAVVCEDEGELPSATLPSGMKITLLSPYWEQLEAMKKAWITECKRAGLLPGGGTDEAVIDDTLGEETDIDKLALLPAKPDAAPANGSSIAMLAEFKDKSALFGADAYAPVMARSLERLGHSSTCRRPLSAFKAAHHGSNGNTSRDLMEMVDARNVLISTNGDKFQHPDRAAVARMVKFNKPGATLHFNYKTTFNEFWAKPSRHGKHRFETLYRDDGDEALRVKL